MRNLTIVVIVRLAGNVTLAAGEPEAVSERGTLAEANAMPVSGEVETKVSHARKVGEDICGVGAYKPGDDR